MALMEFIKQLALEAGEICLRESKTLTAASVEFKNPKDLVTVVDKKVEDFIVGEIKREYPGHDIFGEETGRSDSGSAYCWVIDPIDGTTSYFHGQPFYSVSIALTKHGETVAGCVYAPVLGELFLAEKNQGATLNGKPIRVSSSTSLSESVLATGFACLRAGMTQNNLSYFNRIAPEIRDIRRYGSAAVDLAYVACGRVDGFWEMCLNPYDVAAGVLLVTEAGGQVCDFSGGPDFPDKGIMATNGVIAGELLGFFQ